MAPRSLYFYVTIVLMSFSTMVSSENTTTKQLHIGALVSYGTLIGRVAKQAIEMAVDDINRNESFLQGSKLVVHMLDTNCSAFQGAASALALIKQKVVAIIGPQSSSVSHFVAFMGGETKVPIVSFAATDPALSEFQYPYFFRIAHSDALQMEAIASFIAYYGWRQVIAIYTDDDFGTNAITSLGDALESFGSHIIEKAALLPSSNNTMIGTILSYLASTQTRIFVVHMPQYLAFSLFSEAKYLGMMSAGYVWIVSDSTIGTLNSSNLEDPNFGALQGVIGTRAYYASHSHQFQAFLSKWKNETLLSTLNPHIYGLYAYDSVWVIAYALKNYLKEGKNFTFNDPVISQEGIGNASDLAQLNVLKDGSLLRDYILQTDFVGASGDVRLSSKGDLVRSAFEIVNIIGKNLNVVGYWTNETQLSLSPPGANSSEDANMLLSPTKYRNFSMQIVWPGGITAKPRGWVLPKNGRQLQIAVPKKAGFKQFVSKSGNSSGFNGYCIDVFQNALKYLPYFVPYEFVFYGDNTTPVYDDMIEALADKVYDAVVGDVTITTKRMGMVDFSQPYTESGLVVVVLARDSQSANAWAFLRPFTMSMWLTTLAFFILTGMVIWMLEHKKNRDFRGRPKKQAVTVLWFTFSTLFFSHNEKTKSTLGRFVLLVWLFVVLIITSSYTANLTSILTVQQLSPTIQGISSLQTSDVPVGYQTGSFAQDYLISINIQKERLKPLPTMADYANALRLGPDRGGVAAVVDELPYIQIFLGMHCGFTIAGQEFTKGGWGFAFPKDSVLAVDMSTAILTMAENGELQRIHDLWLGSSPCNAEANQVESNQLNLDSFWGLFLITGATSFGCLTIYMLKLLLRFCREGSHIDSSTVESWSSRGVGLIRSFASYVDEPSARPKSNKKKKKKKKKVDQTVAQLSGDSSGTSSDDSHNVPNKSSDIHGNGSSMNNNMSFPL